MAELIQNVDLLLLVPGVLFLFGGWVLYWVSLNVAGFVAFGALGLIVADLTVGRLGVEPGQALAIRVVALLVGGIAGVLLFRLLHKAGFFLLGALVGCALGVAVQPMLPTDVGPPWLHELPGTLLAAVGGAMLGGLLAAFFSRYVIIVATAASGAGMVLEAFGKGESLAAFAGLALLGAAVQAGIVKPWRRRPKWEEDEDG